MSSEKKGVELGPNNMNNHALSTEKRKIHLKLERTTLRLHTLLNIIEWQNLSDSSIKTSFHLIRTMHEAGHRSGLSGTMIPA